MKYAWIKENKKSFKITLMCKVLKVDRSSYYHWIKMGCIEKRVNKHLNLVVKMKRRFKIKTTDSNHSYEVAPNRLDRGSQYASYEHKNLLQKYGIIQSMSRRGNCWDNAVAESFFHSLKTELIHHENFQTKAQANKIIFEYIEIFYNRQRLHSSNDYLSPVEFEEKMLQNETAA